MGPISVIALALPPGGDGPVLVIAPNPEAVVADARGRLVTPVSAPFATLASGDAGFAARARRHGAWRVLDGGWIAALCGLPEK